MHPSSTADRIATRQTNMKTFSGGQAINRSGARKTRSPVSLFPQVCRPRTRTRNLYPAMPTFNSLTSTTATSIGVTPPVPFRPQVQDQDDRREHEDIPKRVQARPCHAFRLRSTRDKAIEDVAEPAKPGKTPIKIPVWFLRRTINIERNTRLSEIRFAKCFICESPPQFVPSKPRALI
jgi:hypothetical protein